jgi:hypothetical protein
MKTITLNRKNVIPKAQTSFWSVLIITLFGFLSLEALSQTTTTISTAGAGTWTVPCGVTSITVECWGAGGGGGGANGTTAGGGGGGAYSSKTHSVSPGQVISIYIGNGGTGGNGLNNGNPGQDTWFLSNTTQLAKGGNPGLANITGGLGGSFDDSIGDLKRRGGNGADGLVTAISSGGGGGAAGPTLNGGDAVGVNGGVGNTGIAGNPGTGANGVTGSNGNSGSNYGGGGAGARRTNGSRNGGAGRQGVIRITYSISNQPIPYYDSFESGGINTIPACWTSQIVVAGYNDFNFPATSTLPEARPYEGDQLVNWNIGMFFSPTTVSRLRSPAFNTTGHSSVDVEFQWYHDNLNTTTADGITVQYSTNGSTWTNVGSLIPRYSNTQWGWNLKKVTLPAAAGNQGTLYVGLLFSNQVDRRIKLDAFVIKPTPNCAISQAITYTEPFENFSLPDCWSTSLTNPSENNGTGENNRNETSRISLSRDDTSLQETCGGTTYSMTHNLQSGSSFMVKYNSFSPTSPIDNGNPTGFKERLISPNIQTTGTNYVQVEFDWLEMDRFCFTNVNSTNIREGVSVEWSLDGVNWERTAFFPRHVVGKGFNGTWDRKKIVLPAGAGNQSSIKIALHFHSEWGYNMYVDNFEVRPKPDCTSTTTWNGTWSAGAPNATTNAIIDTPYSGGSFICCSLEINAPVTIANNQTIEVLDIVSGTGLITIASQGSFVQRNNASPAPNIVLNKVTNPKTKNDYVYWGSPIAENAFSQIPTEFGSKFHWQSGAGGNWITATETNMAIGKGFITRVKNQGVYSTSYAPITFTFSGTANNGIFSRPIAIEDDNAANFNNHILLANPYPSAINTRNFLSLNTDLGTVYFWTSATPYAGGGYLEADYASWNFTGGTTGNGSVLPSNFISSGQGFFVRAFDNGIAYFNNEMRVSGNNTTFFRTANVAENSSDEEDSVDRYWINLTSPSGKFSQILVGHLFGATYGYDRMYDGERNSVSTVQLYSIINEDYYGINGRPPFEITDSIPLGITKIGSNTETFTLTLAETEGLFTNADTPVYIHDKVLNTYHNLKTGPFTFTMNTPVMNERFEIVYEITGELSVTNPELNEVNIIAHIQNKEITFKGSEGINTIEIYDLTGKVILKIDAKDALQVIAPFNFANAVYIAKIKTTNGTIKSIKLVN